MFFDGGAVIEVPGMKLKLILIFLFLGTSSFNNYHKFYVSVTEIEHNEEAQSLQIIQRVFTDDLENLLRIRYNPSVRLGKEVETEEVDILISKYLQQKFTIEVDGNKLKHNFLGKEYENDMTVFYIEIPEVNNFRKIRVRNTVLMDLFEDQKNLIHVENKGKTKSLILAGGKEEDELKF